MIHVKPRLIDFANPDGGPGVLHEKHFRLGGVSVSRTLLSPNHGSPIGAEQTTVVSHRGPPIDLEWRDPGGERQCLARVQRGLIHVNAGWRPLWLRWSEPAHILTIALDAQILAQAAAKLGMHEADVQTRIAADDPVLRNLTDLYEKEFLNGGEGGQLYLDSLTTVLSVHLLRHYGAPIRPIPEAKGGLSPARLRRVIAYMHDRLNETISIDDLAAVAGLTPHHFVATFKTTVGEPPHRHLVGLRVARARELLASSPIPIAEVAIEVGFANQSHLTHHFRRILGVTPARLRREL